MAGALASWLVAFHLQWPFFVLPFVAVAAGSLINVVLEAVVFAPIRRKSVRFRGALG